MLRITILGLAVILGGTIVTAQQKKASPDAHADGRWPPSPQVLPEECWAGISPNRRFTRDPLFREQIDAKTPNPIVLSGDVQTHWRADLKMHFANPKSETIGVEFTNTSVTSGGDGSETQANWNRLHADNPHLTYHSSKRGYIACTATPKTMQADFRVIVAGAPARTRMVQAGRPGSLPS